MNVEMVAKMDFAMDHVGAQHISNNITCCNKKRENELDVTPSLFAPCKADSVEGTIRISYFLYNLPGSLP